MREAFRCTVKPLMLPEWLCVHNGKAMVQYTFCYLDHEHNDHSRQSSHGTSALCFHQHCFASAKGHADWRYVCTVRQSHHVTLGHSSPQYGWDHMYDEEAALHCE